MKYINLFCWASVVALASPGILLRHSMHCLVGKMRDGWQKNVCENLQEISSGAQFPVPYKKYDYKKSDGSCLSIEFIASMTEEELGRFIGVISQEFSKGKVGNARAFASTTRLANAVIDYLVITNDYSIFEGMGIDGSVLEPLFQHVILEQVVSNRLLIFGIKGLRFAEVGGRNAHDIAEGLGGSEVTKGKIAILSRALGEVKFKKELSEMSKLKAVLLSEGRNHDYSEEGIDKLIEAVNRSLVGDNRKSQEEPEGWILIEDDKKPQEELEGLMYKILCSLAVDQISKDQVTSEKVSGIEREKMESFNLLLGKSDVFKNLISKDAVFYFCASHVAMDLLLLGKENVIELQKNERVRKALATKVLNEMGPSDSRYQYTGAEWEKKKSDVEKMIDWMLVYLDTLKKYRV